MKNLSLIAAIGKNGELGLDNNLIWKIKEDLAFYRKTTLHHKIIMGRKTLESMPSKALEDREAFVLSSRNLDDYADLNTYRNIKELLEFIKEYQDEEFIVVGGAMIYEAFLPYVDTMYLTEIESYANADTFFPDFDARDWEIETIYTSDRKRSDSDVPYVRNKYKRRIK